MSTDPSDFVHPIDGTTPNQLPTVLGVGSLTDPAVDAAADALQHWMLPGVSAHAVAIAALSAAYPLMEAQVKAEAWDEGCRVGKAHGYNVFTPTPCPTNPYRVATIESEAPNV